MKSKIYGLILSMVCAMGLSAQVVITDSIPSVRGYDVKLTTNRTEKNGHNVYIIGFEGGVPYCLDSAVFKKGVAEFKSKKVVPCGIYAFALNSNSRPFANFILNQQNKFTVDIKDENSSEFQKVTVTGSDENSLFFDFIYNTPNDLKEISRKRMNLLETMPDAFVTKYIMAAYGADPQRLQNSRSQQELTNTFLKVTDLSEPRMLYTPIRVPSMVELPIDKEEITESAAIIEYVDDIVSRCQAQNIRNFIISRLFKTLDTHNPDYDPAMVYLYDHFDHSWIEEGSERRIERKINNLKKIIPGAQIPELVSHDINGTAHSTLDIKAHYTVLWFWDPDCDHCQEMTPILHQMYQEHSEEWDFEVFAVEVNNDHDRWVAFSDKNELWDWTNLSTSMGDANLDFIEYFDIMTTPVVILVNNNDHHTIIARQIPLNELSDFFSSQTHD